MPASWIIQLSRSWLPASSGQLGGRAGEADLPVVAAESWPPAPTCARRWSTKRTGARPLASTLAFAASASAASARRARASKLQRVAVAGRPPADLAGAAQEAAAHLVAQGRRRRQPGAVERRRLLAGGERRRGGAARPAADFHLPAAARRRAPPARRSASGRVVGRRARPASTASAARWRGPSALELAACSRQRALASSQRPLAAARRVRRAPARAPRRAAAAAGGGAATGVAGERLRRRLDRAGSPAAPAPTPARATRRSAPLPVEPPTRAEEDAACSSQHEHRAGRRSAPARAPRDRRRRRRRERRSAARTRRQRRSSIDNGLRRSPRPPEHRTMKLATYKDGSRDGQLVVVSRDLATAHYASAHRRPACSRCSTTGTSSRRSSRTWPTTLNHGKARHAFAFEPARCMAPLPRAYQWADGSAFVNHVELVRARAQRRDAGELLDRPADVPGRQRRLPRPARRHRRRAATDWGIDFEAEVAVVTGDVAMGTSRRRGDRGDPPGDARQRRQPAQPDPGRARQGLRLLPEQAGDRVQPGRGHARRARRRLARRPPAPRPREHLERRARRPVQRRRGDDLPLRPADRAPVQDAQRARRLDRRQRHGQQQGLGARLLVHRREAGDRDDRGRQRRRRRSCASATRSGSR